MIPDSFTRRGFLPDEDPLRAFPRDSELSVLDELGRDLPSLLQESSFRAWVRGLRIPELPAGEIPLPMLRLYYVRLGFLASAYVNRVGQEPATLLPRNIALPPEHRALIEEVERLPDPRGRVDKVPYNDALEALASFRETHLEFARRYIAAHVRDPRGTGGTPYLEWLSQLVDETRAHVIS